MYPAIQKFTTEVNLYDLSGTSYECDDRNDRQATEFFSTKHGFANLAHLQKWLPENAHVLDVGAGYSPLGTEVARNRPDIRWTNVDINYNSSFFSHAQPILEAAPENLTYEQGDATKLTQLYGRRTVDCVFSYWLFVHFDKLNPAVGIKAAKECLNVTKQGGLVSIGPRLGLLRQARTHQTTINKSIEADTDHLANEIVAATSLNHYAGRKLQAIRNLAAHPSLLRGLKPDIRNANETRRNIIR